MTESSEEERQRVQDAGLDISHIMCQEEVVQSEQIFFAATGVTDGMLLDGVQYGGGFAKTHSLVLRAKTGTRRMIRAERLLDELIAEEAEIKT